MRGSPDAWSDAYERALKRYPNTFKALAENTCESEGKDGPASKNLDEILWTVS